MRYFDNGGKRAAWVVHRRAGKDNTMLNQVAKMSQRRVGAYWHMFPTQRQAKKAIWDGMDKITGIRYLDQAFPKEIREAANNTEMKITLRNGSIFQLVGSDSYDSLVGSNPIHTTFSEWSLCRPSAWHFVRPILAENDGTAAFIYTPRGRNHGKELYDMAVNNPSWFSGLSTIEDTGALPLSVLDEERLAGMPEELIRQEYYCDFTVGVVGAYYADLIDKLRQQRLITDFQYEYTGVYTHWDIGFRDSTAIIFWRFRPDQGIDIIDAYEGHGFTVGHYVQVLKSKPYQYAGHFLPHDGNDSRFRFATGLSIREQIEASLPHIHIVPKLKVQDGIQAARVVLSTSARTRIHEKHCKQLILSLEHHHREYDEDTRTFSQHEAETWAIHYADAMRYLAVSTQLLRDKFFAPVPAKPLIRTVNELTLDDYVAMGELY